MKLFTIIVTYNGLKWIDKCISSILKESTVVVVDNNSTDDTVNYINQHFPAVKILAQKTNLGFGVANNKGISYAIQNGADAVFLLNQDAYAKPTCIQKLVEASKLDEEFGIISPVHLNGDGTEVDRSFLNLTGPFSGSNIISDLILRQFSKRIYPLKFINAAAWFIPVKVFSKVGGFDPIFFMYGEDVNYCQRLLYHGYKIGVIPEGIIYHDSNNEYYKMDEKRGEKYIRNFRNNYLIKYADITTNNFKKTRSYKLYLIKIFFQKLLTFDFSGANLTSKKYKSISEIDIKKNVYTNRLSSSNYLNIKNKSFFE